MCRVNDGSIPFEDNSGTGFIGEHRIAHVVGRIHANQVADLPITLDYHVVDTDFYDVIRRTGVNPGDFR